MATPHARRPRKATPSARGFGDARSSTAPGGGHALHAADRESGDAYRNNGTGYVIETSTDDPDKDADEQPNDNDGSEVRARLDQALTAIDAANRPEVFAPRGRS